MSKGFDPAAWRSDLQARCPATTVATAGVYSQPVGVQCKFADNHDGDHWGYAGPFTGEVRWPRESPAADPEADQ